MGRRKFQAHLHLQQFFIGLWFDRYSVWITLWFITLYHSRVGKWSNFYITSWDKRLYDTMDFED